MIFRSISLFLSFGFAYFHLFIYILLYLTHTRIEERLVTHHLGLLLPHCNCISTYTASHTMDTSYWPLTVVVFSIEFLSHCIAHRDCLLDGFTQTLHILLIYLWCLYWSYSNNIDIVDISNSKMICPQCLYDWNMINANTTDKSTKCARSG